MKDKDMSGCTEKLPMKLSLDDHVRLKKLALAYGTDMQTKAREYIHAGIIRDYEINTLLAKLRRGEEPEGKSRGTES